MNAQPDTIIIISHGPNVTPEVQVPDGVSNTDAAALLRQAANNLELQDDSP